MLSKIYLHNSSSDVSIEINSIVAGSIKYDKAISTSEELQFGGCIASQFQIEIYETLSEEYDELTYMQVDDSGEEHVIFDGLISNINTDNEVTSIIIAYDRLSASVNVAEWYEELFSTTDEILLSEMLNSLLTYLNYRFENVELTNDFSVKKTVLTNSLDSTSVIKWICELQGGFGYFNGNVFSVGYLSTSNPVTLNVLGGFKKDKVLTKPIDKVQIRNEEQDIGGIYGEGTNALIIQGNPLLFGKGAEELSTIAQSLYNTVKDIIYVPYEAQLPVGEASLDMFTQYTITSSNDNCLSYVLSTSLTGSQLCNQVIKAEGVERRAEAVQDVNKELYVLDYKTTRLKKDVDGFSLQIEQAKKDADTALTTVTTMSATVEGLTTEVRETKETLESQGEQLSQNSTKIEQTSTYISQSVVKNNEVITKINASEEGVKIKAKNIALEGLVTVNEKFKVLEDGSIEAVNAKFSGVVSTGATLKGAYAEITEGSIGGFTLTDKLTATGTAYLPPTLSDFNIIKNAMANGTIGSLYSQNIWYDINGDGKTDVYDFGYMRNMILGRSEYKDYAHKKLSTVTIEISPNSMDKSIRIYGINAWGSLVETYIGIDEVATNSIKANSYISVKGDTWNDDGVQTVGDVIAGYGTNNQVSLQSLIHNFLPLTGGKITGGLTVTDGFYSTGEQTVLYQDYYCFNTAQGAGKAGYWKLCTITITGTYAGSVIEFDITHRYSLGKLYVSFSGATDVSAYKVSVFKQTGGLKQCYIVKTSGTSSGSVYDIYVKKEEAWGNLTVNHMKFPNYMRGLITLTWSGAYVSSVPSGYTEAKVGNDWTSYGSATGTSTSVALTAGSSYLFTVSTTSSMEAAFMVLAKTNGAFTLVKLYSAGAINASLSGTTLTISSGVSTTINYKYIELK